MQLHDNSKLSFARAILAYNAKMQKEALKHQDQHIISTLTQQQERIQKYLLNAQS